MSNIIKKVLKRQAQNCNQNIDIFINKKVMAIWNITKLSNCLTIFCQSVWKLYFHYIFKVPYHVIHQWKGIKKTSTKLQSERRYPYKQNSYSHLKYQSAWQLYEDFLQKLLQTTFSILWQCFNTIRLQTANFFIWVHWWQS